MLFTTPRGMILHCKDKEVMFGGKNSRLEGETIKMSRHLSARTA